MKRGGYLKRKTWLRGGARLKRTRLAPVGARAKREKEALDRFRVEVKANAHGYCERHTGILVLGVLAHHMERRWKAKKGHAHDPAKGKWLCWDCHDLIHRAAVDDWRRWFL